MPNWCSVLLLARKRRFVRSWLVNVTPEDKDTSRSLSKGAAEKLAELAKLSGACKAEMKPRVKREI
jgi:hypothetical protein